MHDPKLDMVQGVRTDVFIEWSPQVISKVYGITDLVFEPHLMLGVASTFLKP